MIFESSACRIIWQELSVYQEVRSEDQRRGHGSFEFVVIHLMDMHIAHGHADSKNQNHVRIYLSSQPFRPAPHFAFRIAT